MATSSVSFLQSDPNLNEEALRIQRQQALAQALMQEGLKPVDTGGRMMGGVAYRVSPLEGLAKILQAYSGAKGMESTTKAQADLDARRYQMMAGAIRSLAPAGTFDDMTTDQKVRAAGSGAPTVANAAALDASAPDGGTKSMWRTALSAALMGNSDLSNKLIADAYSRSNPTNEQKNARDPLIGQYTVNNTQTQNMTPLQKLMLQRQSVPNGSPQATQIDAAIRKENYVAPIDVKPGTPVIDPFDGHLLAYAPKTADGMTLQFGRDANGALVPTRAGAIPGYAGGNAQIAGAEQGAKSANTIMNVTGPGGETVPAWAGPAARVGGGQLGLSGGGGGGSASAPVPSSGGGGAPIPQTQQMPPAAAPRAPAAPALPAAPQAPRLGQSTANATIQKSGGDVIANAPQIMQQSKQTITGLENAMHVLETMTRTGPGVPKTVDALAILNNMGIPLMKGDVDGYKTLHKFLANAAATGAASTGATGSDARFAQFLEGQPNAETMTPGALQGAIRYVLSQHDAAIARAGFITQAYQAASQRGDPNAALTAQNEWSKLYNPRVFEFSRMSEAERAKMKSGMSEAERAKFGQQYNAAHQLGWVQ